jgi:hypothetical protein
MEKEWRSSTATSPQHGKRGAGEIFQVSSSASSADRSDVLNDYMEIAYRETGDPFMLPYQVNFALVCNMNVSVSVAFSSMIRGPVGIDGPDVIRARSENAKCNPLRNLSEFT